MTWEENNCEMGFIFSKKASSGSDNDSELYQDLHSEDMKTRIDIYTNRSNALENRLVALRKIGLFTFTGRYNYIQLSIDRLLEVVSVDLLGKHCHFSLLLNLLISMKFLSYKDAIVNNEQV